MLTEYIQAALRKAHYELIENGDEPYYGEIPDCPGVWGVGATLEAAREDVRGALEAWMLVSLDHHLPIPVIDGIDVNAPSPV